MTTPVALPPHDVNDLGLADEGVRRIEWAEREMPVLRLIRERFARELPLRGLRIAISAPPATASPPMRAGARTAPRTTRTSTRLRTPIRS